MGIFRKPVNYSGETQIILITLLNSSNKINKKSWEYAQRKMCFIDTLNSNFIKIDVMACEFQVYILVVELDVGECLRMSRLASTMKW